MTKQTHQKLVSAIRGVRLALQKERKKYFHWFELDVALRDMREAENSVKALKRSTGETTRTWWKE